MNLEFRGIDRATDVLSFPMTEFPSPADYAYLDTDDSSFDPETGELMLGNIVISKERAKEQAEEYGHSVEREFAFLIAHSMLHLLGYDHMEDEERLVMEKKQREVLEMLDDLTTRDQRMMFGLVTLVHLADNKEQLDTATTEALETVALKDAEIGR